jgi:Spy/CpxP family protein refolding chaperone
MKHFIAVPVAVILLLTAGYSQIDNKSNAHKEFRERAAHVRFEKLGLTEVQRDEIDVIRNEVEKKIIPLKADITLKRLELNEEMKKDIPDRTAVIHITEEINKMELAIKKLKINERLDIHQKLTPEQRKMMKQPLYPQHKKERSFNKNGKE